MSSCMSHDGQYLHALRTSQSPPTAADQFEKDKTSGSAQALLQFTHTSYSLPITPTVYP